MYKDSCIKEARDGSKCGVAYYLTIFCGTPSIWIWRIYGVIILQKCQELRGFYP